MAQNYDLNNTGPEVQERLDQVMPNKTDIEQEVLDRQEGDNNLQEQINTINAEIGEQGGGSETINGRLDTLEEAVGTGGSVDERIAAAEEQILGGASEDYNTLGKVEGELEDTYRKDETYTKQEVNDLITTPDVIYISVVATNLTNVVTDVLPATGSADTIYRVGNWNGTQYDPTMYALFAWNGTTYVCLAVRSFVGEVYDISANHPDGQGNPTPYADLAAALGTNGANIPADIRSGGMSIKFIQGSAQSSDNKYVQYRLMAQIFSTTPSDWQGVDYEPTDGSKNLVESGGCLKTIQDAILPFIPKGRDNSNNNLNITDENGYVICNLKNGHIRTKYFDSEVKDIEIKGDNSNAELNLTDLYGNVIAQFKNGHIRTKDFNSKNVYDSLKNTVWTHFGDSISTNGATVELGEHFYDIIAQRNEMNFDATVNVVARVGRTICYPPAEHESTQYGKIVDYLGSCVPNSTLITILAGINDFARYVPLGDMEFTTNGIVIPSQPSECTTIVKGLCYMYNYFQTHFPAAKVAFMLPILSSRGTHGIQQAERVGYTFQDLWDKITEVSRYFSVEVMKLGPEVGMNPYNAEQNQLYYDDNLHPTAQGQLRMANYLEPKLKNIVNS